MCVYTNLSVSPADWYHTDVRRKLLLLSSANRLKLQTCVQSAPGTSPIGNSIRDIHASKRNELMCAAKTK